MKTTLQVTKELLLTGRHINFRDLEANTDIKSCKLTQRVYDLRQSGWNIKSGIVKGKGGLKEYWLEPQEIERLKNTQSVAISEQNASDEQLLKENKNLAEKAYESLKNEDNAYFEQMGFGLLGGHNYRG